MLIKELLNIEDSIDYHLLIDRSYESSCKLVFHKVFPDLYAPLCLADKLLYLYILNDCDKEKFIFELEQYKNIAKIEAVIPFHTTLLAAYAQLMNADASKIIYNFNEVLLHFYMKNDCLYWSEYLNTICFTYKNVYSKLVNNNIELILDGYWNHLDTNDFTSFDDYIIWQLLQQIDNYHIKIDKEKQDQIINYVYHFQGHNFRLIKALDKIIWHNDIIHQLRIKREAQIMLLQLGR